MRSRKRFILIVIMVIIIFSLCINYTYSQLSPLKRRELMIAYMNGYYQALQLDVEEIKNLKSDKKTLREKVMSEGEKYITLIDIMNPSKNSGDKGYKGSGKNRESESPAGSPKY